MIRARQGKRALEKLRRMYENTIGMGVNLWKIFRTNLTRLSLPFGGETLFKPRKCLTKADNISTTEKPTNLKAEFFLTKKIYIYLIYEM